VKKAWERLSGGELTGAALLEQAAGSAAEALRDEFLTAMNTHNTPSWQVRVVLDGVRVPRTTTRPTGISRSGTLMSSTGRP
jgi:hypothetical protein